MMSWNIRRRMPAVISRPADRWERRAPGVRDLLRTELPSLLGAQEVLPDQLDFLRTSLPATYALLGYGRDADGGGEAVPICYDAERLELLEWRQHALSDTPERRGSRSWGNLIPRIMVAAVFRDRATSSRFLAVNTHLDHLSRASRVRSAQMILAVVADTGLPAVVTGDMNDGAGSPPLDQLQSAGLLTDAWCRAGTRASGEWGTFPSYRPPRDGGRRLDWLLTTPDVHVARAAINPGRYGGGWPSDHLPVHAVLTIAEDPGPA